MPETKYHSEFVKFMVKLPTPGFLNMEKNLNERTLFISLYYVTVLLVPIGLVSEFLIPSNTVILTGTSWFIAFLTGGVFLSTRLLPNDKTEVKKKIRSAAEIHVEHLNNPSRQDVRLSDHVRPDYANAEEYIETLTPAMIRWVERYFNKQVRVVQEAEKQNEAAFRKQKISLNAHAIDSIVSNKKSLDKSIGEHV